MASFPCKIVAFEFYGVSAEEIAAWSLVSLRKARRIKSGEDQPTCQQRRLIELHAQGRVLTDEWRGWRVRRGVIVDPEGNVTTEKQLRCYSLVYQWAASIARRDEVTRAQYDALLRLASNG